MPALLSRVFLVATLIVVFPVGAGFAQPADEETPASSGDVPADKSPKPLVLKEFDPKTYYLRNEDGELVPVLGISLAEFQRLLQLDLKLTNPEPNLPSYSLQELTVTGRADATAADLDVTFVVRSQRDGWVSIPLLFSNAVMQEGPDYNGEGEFFVTFDPEKGYVGWLRGQTGKQHRISLKLQLPIRRVGGEFRLAVKAPRATSSQLELLVPVPQATATVSGGLLQIKTAGNSTSFIASGLGPDFELGWRKGDAKQSDVTPLFDVRSEIQVQIEGERLINADALLRVRTLRGEFESFIVRLPKNAELASVGKKNAQATVVELDSQSRTEGRRVEVKLDRRTSGPVEVRLLTYMNAPEGEQQSEFDLDGFEVEDAIRQSGVIDFVIQGDWDVDWTEGSGIRRVAYVPEGDTQKIAARFEFVQQPYSLRFGVSRKQTRVSVAPTYMLFLEPSRARLEAILKYRVRGAEAYGINVEMSGWQLETVGPETLIDNEKLDHEKLDPLFVPLNTKAPRESSDFELRIVAYQDLANASEGFSLQLPRPQADTATPASVVVSPASNVQLSINEEAMRGLRRDAVPANLDLPPRRRVPVFCRQTGSDGELVFAGSLTTLTRAIAIASEHHVAVDEQIIHVKQTFDYRVSFEPVDHLDFAVPRSLYESNGFSIAWDGQPMPYVLVEATEGEANGAELPAGSDAIVRADLGGSPIGDVAVEIRYDYPVPEPLNEDDEASEDEGLKVKLPLVVPVLGPDASIGTNTLRIVTGDTVAASVSEGAWQLRDPRLGQPEEPEAKGQLYQANGAVDHVSLSLTRSKQPQTTALAIPKMWIQTWLNNNDRRDRVAFALESAPRTLAIELPPGAVMEDAAVDGQRVEYGTNAAGTVLIDFGSDEVALRDCVLEMWYRFDSVSEWPSRKLVAPRVANSDWIRHSYWQLVTPDDKHLLLPPTNMTAEFRWRRNGPIWYRQPVMNQAQLEQWIGATPQAGLPPVTNSYLFSSFGGIEEIRVTMPRRHWILLFASGAALLIGLAVIYFPFMQHPASLFVAAVALFGAGLLVPQLAFLAAQAAWLGVLLIAAASGLKWIAEFRSYRRSTLRGAVGSKVSGPDSQTAKMKKPQKEGSSYPTTAAAPANFSAAEPRA